MAHGAIAGAASMSKKKRNAPKMLKGTKKGVKAMGHMMDREMNTPQSAGPWGMRLRVN